MPNPSTIGPKQAGGYPQEGPERSKTAQGHPGPPQETPRDGQKASRIVSGSALEALWTRFGTMSGAKWDQNGPKIVPKALESGVGQGLSCSLRFSYDFLNFFKENVVDCPEFVGKAKIVSWGGIR